MEFIRASLIKDRVAATEVLKVDLPVHAVSHLIVTLSAYNESNEGTLAEMLPYINSIRVEHDGKSVFAMQSEDAYGHNSYIFGNRPVFTGKLATDNLNRCLTFMVPFGRRIFDPEECYPETKKGEFTLSLDYAAPATAMDNGTLNIEAVALPGARPSRFLKSVMKVVSAPGATGDNEVELPIGNKIMAILIRMTTWAAAAADIFGVEGVTVMKSEKQYGYSFAKAHCLTGDLIHHYDTQHGAIAAQGLIQPASQVIIDYDPNRDGQWLLETAGESRMHMVLDMGVDEATYVTVLELVDVRNR